MAVFGFKLRLQCYNTHRLNIPCCHATSDSWWFGLNIHSLTSHPKAMT